MGCPLCFMPWPYIYKFTTSAKSNLIYYKKISSRYPAANILVIILLNYQNILATRATAATKVSTSSGVL